jgi:hypothetical protein
MIAQSSQHHCCIKVAERMSMSSAVKISIVAVVLPIVVVVVFVVVVLQCSHGSEPLVSRTYSKNVFEMV